MIENIEKFITEFVESLRAETFVKLTLGTYKGDDAQLQKLLIRLIETRKGERLFFLYRYDTRDTAKNHDFHEGVRILRELLGESFFTGHLFTTANDFQLEIGRKGRSRLNVAKPTFRSRPERLHDREKRRYVNPGSFYLQALGITTDVGAVRDKQQDKWRQINRFIETLAGFVEKSALNDRRSLRILDMGSGKGYLTFATYDYFRNIRGVDVQVTGVDSKSNLVTLCNDIARSADFAGLRFENARIGEYEVENVDILIALHACNTATDDAVFQGIRSKAEMIIVAPCCHQELRPQITPPAMFRDVFKHGVMLEREAESITDGLRSLLLERAGYATRIFEFVSVEHTPKNNMIVGTRTGKPADTARYDAEIAAIKGFYGISRQRLETLLAGA
jgi:hypothetical protein